MTTGHPRLATLVREYAAVLATAGLDSARLDAEVLLCHVLEVDRAWLVAHGDEPAPEAAVTLAASAVGRRLAGEPVAYITGHREFWSLDLEVDRHTLIPRPESELLVEQALLRLPASSVVEIADLGTGSGAIAIAIASERPCVRIDASDTSAAALAVAARNVARHACGRVRLLEGDWWTPLAGHRYPLALSNPPYLDALDPHLEPGDLRHEPRAALSPGDDGLAAIRVIVRGAPGHLLAGGWLLLEHGNEQGTAVRECLLAAGFVEVDTVRDLAGHERVSGGRLP